MEKWTAQAVAVQTKPTCVGWKPAQAGLGCVGATLVAMVLLVGGTPTLRMG
ncbi:MAG: hypothetical protein NZ874_00900 [Fimbriimonadales bacterium]|nr:hypothetical protein [Fimbriimonadales bacterium]